MRRLPVAFTAFIALVSATAACAQEAAAPAAMDVTARWHDRYVSEGRDNLETGGLVSAEGLLEWGEWRGGGWFGAGLAEDYQELNLFVERGVALGPVRLWGRYARLDFPADQRNDNELAAGATLSVTEYLAAGVDYTYSTEAEGGFATVAMETGGTLIEDRLELTAVLLQGFDYGYASESFDGANHREASLEAALHLTGRWRLVGSVAHSWALADVERSGGGDLTWGSVGIATRL